MKFSGTIGKKVVASSWKGHDYIKAYAVPANPRSKEQTKVRAIFNHAIEAWRNLSPRQKEFYNKIADGMSGYNLFVGRYIEAVRGGQEPEAPMEITWRVTDGSSSKNASLIVTHHGRTIFGERLDGKLVKVALTRKDVPYNFIFRTNGQEEEILRVVRALELPEMAVLKSPALGIRLKATVLPWQPARKRRESLHSRP